MKRPLIFTLFLFLIVFPFLSAASANDAPFKFTQRFREKSEDGSWKIVYKTVEYDPAKTAVIVCDVWDGHYCERAGKRVGELAPKINEVLHLARDKGALIIHAPSGTMDVYKDLPQRKLALAAPAVETEVPLQGWIHRMEDREPPLPVDTTKTACDDPNPGPVVRKYSKQHEAVDICEPDAIGDGHDVFYLMKQRGIEHVVILGVHVNMCVLGRPFGIRQLVLQGMDVVLMRDMTDAMYSPTEEPRVSHVRGTELVIEHIEKYWCPTVTSTDLTDRPAFRFEEDKRPHVVFIVSDDHYDADKTIPGFAQMLREEYGCHCTVLHGQHKADVPQTAELQAADCLVLYVRRLALPVEQLARIREYLNQGQPFVGLRTSSHAFSTKFKLPDGYKPAPGTDEWPEFDAEVQGGNYNNHAANHLGTDVKIVEAAADHPILAGVAPNAWHSTGSLYRTAPIAADCTLLMTGSITEKGETETQPLTWTRLHNGGRVVYSSLGHPEDFAIPAFRRMLVNAIFWAMDREAPKSETTD